MSIDKLKIKNIKCFSEVESSIRPITMVVGENNTGKTTFLSAYKLMHDLLYTDQPIIYSSIEDLLKGKTYKYLGGPNNIKRDQNKADDMISIGAVLKINEKDAWDIEYSIENGKFCRKIIIQCSEDKIEMSIRENNTMKIIINSDKAYDSAIPLEFSINFFGIIPFLLRLENIKKNTLLSSKISNLLKFKQENKDLKNISCSLLDPVHSVPKSQYNPEQIKTTDSSYVLCKIAEIKRIAEEKWKKINEKFIEFGKNAKLFQSLDITSHGDGKDSPFSIKVEAGGVKKDITNVGYGVSQFLPILANILISDSTKDNTFLIQQPEVHLHPRVEAEFATLMVQTIKEYNKKYRFICETHSDYVIKRLCINVMKKIISPDELKILYFEQNKDMVKIHEIDVDETGSLINSPENYRNFFLEERDEFLGF